MGQEVNPNRACVDRLSTCATMEVDAVKMHTISEVAKLVNLSRQSVYKKLKGLSAREKLELGEHLLVDGQMMLSDDGISTLFGKSKSVSTDGQPTDNKGDSVVVSELRNQLLNKDKEVDRMSGILSNLLAQLEAERKLRGEERQRSDTIILKLGNDIANLQKTLEIEHKPMSEALNHPPKPVVPWSPPPRVDPMAAASWAERIYTMLFCPHKMRTETQGQV